MASKYWIKLYHEILDDWKMAQLSDRLFRRTIQLFLLAGELDQEGNLPSLGEMAWRLRTGEPSEILEAELVELSRLGIVGQSDGIWLVTNFAKRQEAVSSTERWRKWRDRQRQQEMNGKTTSDKQPANDQQTTRLTDTDIDKEADTDEIQMGELTAEVCRVSRKDALMLERYDQRLIEGMARAGYTAEQVKAAFDDRAKDSAWWYIMDWRGQKGQRPTIKQINETIGQAVEWDGITPSSNGKIVEPAGFAAVRKIQEEIAHGNA